MHDDYGIQNEMGEWFTWDGPKVAGFESGVSLWTCRYTHDQAERCIAQLARNWHPVHATMHPLPPLTDAEAHELDAMRNPPRPRRPRRVPVRR